MVQVDMSGLDNMSKDIKRTQRNADVAGADVSRRMARDLVEKVKAHASGRPGPQVVTDQYRQSIRIMETNFDRHIFTTAVGTEAPQAARLEFGFVGTDALGRHYHQPPFPHWRPALQELKIDTSSYGQEMADKAMK